MSIIDIRNNDCLIELKEINDESIDAIVTDPPYGLSFMSKRWDYDVPSVEIWAECLRVLKPGGHLLSFAGTRTQHRMAVRIEDAGFEIRDMIAWVYGSGFPKSHNGEWGGTALKPALEPITMARKPLIGTVEKNWNEHGTGALNIDGCRVGDEVLPTMTAGQAKIGTFERGVMVTPERTGRWPANLIHDGGEYFGEQSRFFYCAKASKKDRGENNNHPTVKPTDLMRYLCRLVTPPNGVVLDPFMGSGSTGKAAVLEGLNFVGIEKDPDYFCIAKERIEAAQ